MTEFLICASFVLIPLFLGLSMLAKYIDIKQAAVQAARYEAWEYTVWYATDTENIITREMMSGFGDGEDDKFVVQPLKNNPSRACPAPWTPPSTGGTRSSSRTC